MAIVLILIDALRSDYVEEKRTPFLYGCAKGGEYYRRVIPGPGFCERSEILTGLAPAESGFFTAIGYDPDNSPFRQLPGISVISCLERTAAAATRITGERLGKAIWKRYKRILKRYCSRNGITMGTYNIPPSFLPYFALTEDFHDYRDHQAFPHESLLSLLEKDNRSYCYESFTSLTMDSGTQEDCLRTALDRAPDKTYSLYLVYLPAMDRLGHVYGPRSPELFHELAHLDSALRLFVQDFSDKRPDTTFVFLGDHGMHPVDRVFDARKEIRDIARRLGVRSPGDYLYFLDSTMVRIWFHSPRAEHMRGKLLESRAFLKHGRFLAGDSSGIPHNDRRYGDIAWQASPGTLVFPDFFHRLDECKGMHGYDPELPESQGTCIIHGPLANAIQAESIHLNQIFNICREKLGL